MKKLKIRLLSSILAFLLTLSSLPLYAVSPELADTGEEVLHASDSTEYSSEGVFITAEDTSKRGEFEKHYLCSDGTFIAVSYPEAVHYKNENGEWEEVDNELHYDSTVSRYATSNEDFTVSFAGQATRENLISLSSNGFDLSWSLAAEGFSEDGSALIHESSGKTSLAAQVKTQNVASLTADSASELQISDVDTFAAVGISGEIGYPKLFEDAPEISVDYTVYHNKIEEDIYINAASDIRSFQMNLNVGELTAVLMDNGSVEFVNEDGAVQYRIGIPYMEDAAFAVLNDIEVTVEQNGWNCVITYMPDEEWFISSDRVYPIMFDPSITTGEYNSNLVDTYVVQGDTTNHSSEQRLHIGVNSSKIERTYLKVNNLPIIDSSMPILSATMTLALWTGTSTGKTVDVYKASAAWDASTITYANQPALVNSNKLASCAFDVSNLYYTFDLSEDVSNIYSATYGYVLKYADESLTDQDFNSLYSSEYTKKAYRPVIKIVYGYALPSGLSEGGIYSFQNAGSKSFLTVHNGTDANGTNVYQYSTTIANLSNNQKFKLEYVESTGSYIFRAMCSSSGTNRVLDIVKSNGYVEKGGNVQIYVNDDPIAQEWLILGSGTSEFILLPRSNMNLALTAYPSTANGTSSGTTSTSAGNIFVSTYSATNDYQKWHLVENGEYVEIENAIITIAGSDNVVVGSTVQLTAVTTPAGLDVTWSSDSSAVMLVENEGLVAGLRAGKATITASYTDPATGKTTSASKIIYVRIENGVYYLQNLNSGYYLHTQNGYINDQTDVFQYSKYADSTSTVTKLRQQWKIYYLGSGYYSIRPMHRLNMGLHADLTTGNVDIINIGTTDTKNGVPYYCRWTIEMYSTGWIIRNEGADSRALQIDSAFISSGATAIAATCTLGALNNRWAIVSVTSPATGAILYNTASQTPASGTALTKSVAPEETRTLSDMSLLAVAYSPNSVNQTFRWSSSNTSVATVNSSTGAVTGVSSGTVTITGKWAYNTSYTVSYTLNVTEIANGTYFIENRETSKYVQPDDNDAPNYITSGSIMEQMSYDGETYQRWIFTHTGDGYYKIISDKSGYAMTVPTGSESSKEVNLILTTYTGSNNQKWSVILTANGSYKIKAKSAESSSTELVVAVEVREIDDLLDILNIQQKPYQNNDSYLDEWYIFGPAPTSGDEIPYQPSLWNYSPVQTYTNCYAYALNNQINPTTGEIWYIQPGEAAGYTITSSTLSAETLISYVQADAEVLGFEFEEVGQYEKCPEGSYKVVLVISPGNDYHWYRQNPDGFWSHKLASGIVHDWDASDHLIYDPQYADRNYSYKYTEFVGYFMITPLNNMYLNTVALSTSEMERIELLPTKSVLPSCENASKIVCGMTYQEVTDLIGLPQRLLTSGLIIVEYELSDGSSAQIEYVKNSNGYYIVEKMEFVNKEDLK